MTLCLSGVLDAEDLRFLHERLGCADFDHGASTAGWNARGVKHNLQAFDAAAAQRVHAALQRHPLFSAAVLPARLGRPLFARYQPGMSYGLHVDDALMGGEAPLRTDVAVTVFLSEPSTYDGGELVIETHAGTLAYKLAAGQAVIYPASHLHRVAEVTLGERLAAVLWVQSRVRDPAQREVLFDLDSVRRSLWRAAGERPTPDFDLLNKTYANLLRAWVEA